MSQPGATNRGFWGLLALLVILLLLIHSNWIFSLAPLVSGDWPYFFPETLKSWFPFHPLWINYDGVGRGIAQGNFVFLFSLSGLFARLGANFEIISRLLFFIPVLILAPYASFLAVREVSRHRLAAIIGSFIYSLNTYFIVIQGGHMHLCMAYALAPLAFYFAIKQGPRAYLWMFTTLGVMGLYDVRMTLVMGLFAAILAFFYKVRRRQDVWLYMRNMLMGAVALVLFNSFWILPTIFTISGPFSRNVFDQQALNWVSQPNSLVIHHPFWSSNGVTDFVFASAPFYMFALPIIAFLPFTLPNIRPKRELLFYSSASLISFILLMQENSLFAGVYHFIYYNVPIMSMFRESSKMFFLTAFCYSMLIGLLIAELLRQKERRQARIIMAIVVFVLVIPLKPYITGNFIKTYRQEPISQDMQRINDIVKQKEQTPSRTLWISHTPKFATSSSTAPSVDAVDFGGRFWSNYADPFEKRSLAYLTEPYAPALLNFAGIEHVIVPNDTIDANYRHHDHQTAGYYAQLASKWRLKPVTLPGNNKAWKNTRSKPYLYFSTNNVSVDSLDVYSGIDDSTTATYLFKDQQAPAQQHILESAITNTELNPFQPQYLQLKPGKVSSTYPIPTGAAFDLHAPQVGADLVTTRDVTRSNQLVLPANSVTAKNLYANGSFEAAAPSVSDCNNHNKTTLKQNGIGVTQVRDATDGTHGLKVVANSHIACFFTKIADFDKKAHYFIALDYKYVSGPAPMVALQPYDKEPTKREAALSTDHPNQWAKFHTLVKPGHFTNTLDFNIYVPTIPNQQRPSEVVIDNVRVFKLANEPTGYLKTKQPPLPALSAQSVSSQPTEHRLRIDKLTDPRLLVFSETYDPNWILTIKKVDGSRSFILPEKNHLLANGFANSWWIDPAHLPDTVKNGDGAYELALTYAPQRWFYNGAAITGATLVVGAGYAAYSLRRYRQQPKGYWTWRRK